MKRAPIARSRAAASALAFALAIAVACGCSRRPSREDCDAALEHYVDLAITEDPGVAKLKGKELEAARDMKRELRLSLPAYRKMHDACVTECKRSEVSCATGAETTADWEACFAK